MLHVIRLSGVLFCPSSGPSSGLSNGIYNTGRLFCSAGASTKIFKVLLILTNSNTHVTSFFFLKDAWKTTTQAKTVYDALE